ncbi:MAG: SdrD B-like domain-containing protein [Stenotrophomonas sp.]
MNNQIEQDMAVDGSVAPTFKAGAGNWRTRLARIAASLALTCLLPATALATVIPQNVNLPTNMGQSIDTPLTVSWMRTATDAGVTNINVVLPASVSFVPPAAPGPNDCTYVAATRTVSCPVAPGTTSNAPSGSVGFTIRASELGSFNLTALSSNSPTPATGTTTVRETGNLQVAKTLVSPDNGQGATGGIAVFELDPRIAAGGSNLPAGARIVVTDQLPSDVNNVVTAITPTPGGSNPVCDTVASANSTRSFSCTYSGPMTAAQFNAAKIRVEMRTNGLGTHTNNATIATQNESYFDADPNDNSGSASYNIVLGTDIEAKVSFPGSPIEVNTVQNLVLTYQNNGPQTSTTGGKVSTIIPDGFIIGTLPAGCAAEPAEQLVVNGVTYPGTLVTCDAGVVASGSKADFTIPVTTPATGSDGRFPVVVTPPAALKDWNEGNNSVLAPYQINEPYTDIRLGKTKSPGSGPISPGAPITTTLTISNGTDSTSDAQYTPSNPLWAVDYMRPEEMDASHGLNGLANVSPGWECTVARGVTPPAGVNAALTTQVACKTTGTGTLVRGTSMVLTFETKATAVVGQLNLSNRACAGSTALTQLGINPANAALPADRNATNDCANAGAGLNLTDVINDTAWVNIEKFSSVDNATWIDEVANAPTLQANAETVYWKIVVSTPTTAVKSNQKTIPTLNLTDNVPGVLNTAVFKGQVSVLSNTVVTGLAATNCPVLAVGSGGQTCVFTNVTPGTQIEVVLAVNRELASTAGAAVLTNTASLTSPNAVLTSLRADNNLSDSAAVKVLPRTDYRMTSKTVTPSGSVLIGEPISFTLTARNHGPDVAPLNDFVITDTLPTGTATSTDIAYEIISVTVPSGSKLNCAASNYTTGAISCINSVGTIASQTTETVTINARVKKPANLSVAAGGVVYAGVTNEAVVSSNGGICQWLPGSSTSCNDAASDSNNSGKVTFDVKVPTIDLQQKKTQIYPAGRSNFVTGDKLRYRMSTFNLGPSQAENVEIRDRFTVPAGFTASFESVENVNSGTPVSGYTYKTNAPVSCAQQGAELVCKLHTNPALNTLDKMQMVAFDVVFNVVGDSSKPVLFTNLAYACGDETENYETQGKCSADATDAGNNLEQVNDVVFPAADLEVVSKTTVTTGPVNVGQPIQYSIVVRNAAGSRVEKMRVTDTLPQGFEWVRDASHPLTFVVDAGSAATLSQAVTVATSKPAVGTDNVCYLSAGPTAITALGQQQAITCDLGGSFPVGAANTLTLTLWARTVPGVFTGGYAPVNHTNKANIEPGRDENDEPTSIDLVPGNNEKSSTTQVTNAQIGGRVFQDANDNGDVDAGDNGIGGVKLTLTGTDLYGNVVNREFTTAANGDYLFDHLAPSDASGYTITQTQPAAYPTNGVPQPNTPRTVRNGTSTGVSGTYIVTNTATTSVISGVVLGTNANGVQFDFPEPAERKLSGYVYVDQDNSKTRTASDVGISGAKVELLEVETNRSLTAFTNAQGFYEFVGLSAGKTYRLREPLPTTPAGLVNLADAVNLGRINNVLCPLGTCTITANAGGVTDQDEIAGIKLVAGNGTEFNFGENLKTTIAGVVYLDRNDDGAKAATEPGIENVVVTLEVKDDLGNWVSVTTLTTDSQGAYSYADALIGKEYRLTETQPAGIANGKENGPAGTTGNSVIETGAIPATGSSNNNFGEVAAAVSGVVYLDSNNNGVQDAGEPGLPGVQVTLSAATATTNALGQPLVTVATTDADGRYRFADLLADTYAVTEQLAQPTYNGVTTHNGKTTAGNIDSVTVGTVTEAPSKISGIVLPAGKNSLLNNFGEILVAAISGTVYVDRNDNGSFDAADAGSENSAANGGIVGVEIVLYAADGVTEIDRTVTDAQGNYAFADLPSGVNYVVRETQPNGYAPGKEHPANEITITALSPSGSSGNNYGEKLGALAGYVYEDFSGTAANNNNGNKDAGEKAIAGVTLTLTGTDSTGKVITPRTVVTNAAGEYSFGDLLQGTYTITETQPTAYIDGKHTVGNATTAGSNAVANVISGIGLDAGQSASGYLFGELANAPISGTIYIDRNNDGTQDAGEPGIPNISLTVEVEDGPGNWVKVPGPAIVTDSNGHYTYPEAVTGKNYRVTETQPADLGDGKENGTVNTGTPNVILITNLPSTGSSGNNFGEIAAVLSGVVYLDSNNNGVQDAGEPGLPNVEVSLPVSVKNVLGQDTLKATTDANGNYVFQDLLAGTYVVTQQAAQPSYNGAPTINGITTAGSTGGVVTPVATVPSAISAIALAAGGVSEKNNFGEVLQVSISGAVFLDVNNDGAMLGATEAGLEGVVIELSGVDDTGANVNLSTTTDKDGKFNFEGLRPGKYTLTEPTQPTGTANGITTAGSAGGTATPVTTVPSKIADIDLSVPGSASVDNLFGEIPRSSAISGKVWEDTNNDGVVDPGEKGIAGVIVELEGTAIDGTPITATVTTDADGNYSFDELPPGTYTVTEPNQPPGTLDGKTVPGSTGGTATAPGTTPSKISTIVVGVNETSKENNFGEVPVGSIAGFVYNDSNDDGIKQNDEGGYAMIDVVLTGTDDLGNPVNVQGVTDAQGHYVFQNLRPGTYIVTEPNQPAETLNGLTTAGSIDGVKSGAKVTGKETVPSQIDGIVLKPGNNSVDNNFGEIGDSPDMLVSKSSTTVKFTVNNVATYTIRVRNGGQKPSFGEYIVKDRLPVGLTLAEVPAGNNWTCTGAVGDARFECRSSEVVSAGTTSLSDISVRVNVGIEAANAGTVNNAVLIEGGGENEFRTPTVAERNTFEGNVGDLPVCDTAITQNVCRVPNQVQLSASVGGTVWFDVGSEDTFLDAGDERLQSWIVELIDSVTGQVSQSTVTAVDGSYRFGDVVPGVKWNIQFRDPSSGVLWAWPVNQETVGGMGVACDGPRAIDNNGVSACRVTENGTSQLQVVLEAGQHLPQQSLPVDPSGVVYDAVTRNPVPGSIVTITPVGVCTGYDPRTAILNAGAGGYRVEGNAVSMTVGNNGYYQFMFGPAAPARCEFQLTVTPPGGYQFVSSLIPAQAGSLSPLGSAGSSHLVQPQTGAPSGAVGTPTQYWLNLFAGSAVAGVVHNHIPLDTAEATGLVITKTGDRQTAEIGDTVQYTITVRQTAGSAMATVNIVDTLPRGFTYIDGTGRVGGRAVEDPFGKPGPRLGFNLGPITVGGQLVLTYRVRVGVGAQQGDGINRAQAHGCSITGGCIDPGTLTPVPGSVPSNRAEYRVRVTGGVFTEEACVLGKIFVDCNNNHVQDEEELGIPGVRMYFSNGTWMISDSEGKYSYCGLTPQSHTLKVDPSTLPVGSRLTTSSNRNLGDADSLFLDLKNGELHRADFVEGSCSNPLLEQVKARRTQGEVRAPETETGQSQLRFDSKPVRAPQQATDSSNQGPIVQPRPNPPSAAAQQEVQP